MISGTLFILSAPSGAGKTSLIKRLLADEEGLRVSLSQTTRPMRPGEEDGRDYHFVDLSRFRQMIEAQELLEYAQVFGNYYATSRSAVQQCLSAGIDVILEIDWQGARQVRERMQTTSVFILPPSRPELEKRLRGRGTDSDEIIDRRMRDAISEMQHYGEYDYLVVNDDFDMALAELKAIVTCQRLRLSRQKGQLAELLAQLLA